MSLRADSSICVRGNLSRHVMEQLVAKSCRFVEAIGRVYLGAHCQQTGPDQDFDSDAVVLQSPAESKAFIRFREPVPSEWSDPRSAERTDEPTQVDVGGERGLKNRSGRFRRLQRGRTQEAERASRDAIPEVGPLHELTVGKSMEGPGELLRMDAEPSAQTLEGDVRIWIVGKELEDLAVVVAEVVQGLPRRWVQ